MQLWLFLGIALTLSLRLKMAVGQSCSQANPTCDQNKCCSNVNGSVTCRNLASKNTLCSPRNGNVVYSNYCPCREGLTCSPYSNRCTA